MGGEVLRLKIVTQPFMSVCDVSVGDMVIIKLIMVIKS